VVGAAAIVAGVADNEVMDFEGDVARGSRFPRGVYDVGREPDPLYSLANERTYLAWLRFAVTLLAGAVAIDRLLVRCSALISLNADWAMRAKLWARRRHC